MGPGTEREAEAAAGTAQVLLPSRLNSNADCTRVSRGQTASLLTTKEKGGPGVMWEHFPLNNCSPHREVS